MVDHVVEDLIERLLRPPADRALDLAQVRDPPGHVLEARPVGLLVRDHVDRRGRARPGAHALGELRDRDLLGGADVEHLAERLALHQPDQRTDHVRDVQKQRRWVPSPYTVIGCSASAWRTNLGMTIP